MIKGASYSHILAAQRVAGGNNGLLHFFRSGEGRKHDTYRHKTYVSPSQGKELHKQWCVHSTQLVCSTKRNMSSRRLERLLGSSTEAFGALLRIHQDQEGDTISRFGSIEYPIWTELRRCKFF